jgi:DNA-directed RNA polymerase beta subunit
MSKVDKAFRQKEAGFGVHSREVQDDGEEYANIGVGGILAATENLLAVNRGLRPPDERDSSQYKKTFRTHQLLADRIKLDAGKLRRSLLYRAAKQRSLKSLHSFYFDPYVEGQLIGNPLSAPLEEINPMQLVEQARRTTLMGPGGLGSDQAITEDSQALHPSSFGFMSTLEGPESSRIGVDTRVAWGAKLGSDGRLYQQFKDRRTGRHKWMSPQDLDGLVIKLPD